MSSITGFNFRLLDKAILLLLILIIFRTNVDGAAALSGFSNGATITVLAMFIPMVTE